MFLLLLCVLYLSTQSFNAIRAQLCGARSIRVSWASFDLLFLVPLLSLTLRLPQGNSIRNLNIVNFVSGILLRSYARPSAPRGSPPAQPIKQHRWKRGLPPGWRPFSMRWGGLFFSSSRSFEYVISKHHDVLASRSPHRSPVFSLNRAPLHVAPTSRVCVCTSAC